VLKQAKSIEVAFSVIPFIMLLLAIPVSAAEKTSVGYGELRWLDISAQTVVVEVFLGHKLCTVGGPLSKDAVLKVGGMKSGLDAFSVGNVVRVGWRLTTEGHEITFLEAPIPLAKTPTRSLFYHIPAKTVIGDPQSHVIGEKDTLLDIARHFDLGINEIEDLYPQLDPWIPPEGRELTIPSQWILPAIITEGIVVNVPEMRLYHFTSQGVYAMVETFPVGIGDFDWPTPLGVFKISEKWIPEVAG
jgi:hypothetical protein